MRPSIPATLSVAALCFLSPLAAQPNPLEPPSTGGLLAADRDIAKLLVHARLLVIGAHPDDEDTSLLTLVARGMGGEAAYLSLSRGEGGQNLIGPELGIGLGLIRTEELLAARRTDGARQYFSRAYDFGYTRSLEETLRRWPQQAILEDTVRVVRRFRPQVIVSVFPNDGRGGHGQHQAAGVVAHQAYAAAADATAWANLAAEGALPWTPEALYRNTWFDREATTLVLPTGVLDPLTGKSIHQLAMASRSQHRSQDMGRLQEPGPQQASVGWVAGGGGTGGAVLFAGIDTRLRALALLLPAGAVREATWANLEAVETLATEARARLQPTDLAGAAVPLAAAVEKLRQARQSAAGLGAAGSAAADLLDEKLAAAERALVVVTGLVLDVAADRDLMVPGQPFPVTVTLWNSGRTAIAVAAVELISNVGWRQRSAAPVAQELLPGALGSWTLEAEAPAGSVATVPYFLERPLQGDLYDWSQAPASARGLPFQSAPLLARVRLGLGALPLVVEREAVLRVGDQALGEVRRPLRAVPALEVEVEPDLVVWPLPQAGGGPSEHTLEVVLTSRSTGPVAGTLELTLPAGWPALPAQPFSLPAARERDAARAVVRVVLRLPKNAVAGNAMVQIVARTADGAASSLAVPVVSYSHIRPVPRPEAAIARLAIADIRVPVLRRVGYVVGASDRVPGYLTAIGVPLALLGERDLAEADLSIYDAIVIGSRAYETVPALARANPRLLDYVRAGGLMIVQYQQYPFVEGGFAPLPLEIARPHDRITDETAAATLLAPSHPAFTKPNALTAADWTGWVQERGLYFAHSFDPGYTPLLEFTDPGQPAQRGGLLVAQLGKGTYVYTGLAFFRQLPAGVPGAYRLFANLLGLAGR